MGCIAWKCVQLPARTRFCSRYKSRRDVMVAKAYPATTNHDPWGEGGKRSATTMTAQPLEMRHDGVGTYPVLNPYGLVAAQDKASKAVEV